MAKLKATNDARTSYDQETGAVRSFFGSDLVSDPGRRKSVGKKAADVFFRENRKKLKIEKLTLEYQGAKKTDLFQTHRYGQTHNGITVYASRAQVTFRCKDAKLISCVNKLEYDLPKDLTPQAAKLTGQLADKFKSLEIDKPELFIYRHKKTDLQEPFEVDSVRREMLVLGKASAGKLYLVWRIQTDTKNPMGYWEILVDATRKVILAVRDRRRFATRQAYVFWPDPITSSRDTYLSWNSSESTLNDERLEVTLENLDNPSSSTYKLQGSWVKCVDREEPSLATPETTGDFKYTAKDRRFLNVMAYYYLDRLIIAGG